MAHWRIDILQSDAAIISWVPSQNGPRYPGHNLLNFDTSKKPVQKLLTCQKLPAQNVDKK